MRICIALCALLGLAACIGSDAIDRPDQISKRLDPSKAAYVSVPPDGNLGRTVYKGSGHMTSTTIAAAFSRHLQFANVAHSPQTFDQAMAAAREAGAAYLIAPDIEHWEDRQTTWSGRSDRIKIGISIYEVETAEVIETAVVSATNGARGFFWYHPQYLLPHVITRYVDSLFPYQSGY